MKKIRKLKEDFKSKNLKGKIRFIICLFLGVCGIGAAVIGLYYLPCFWRWNESFITREKAKYTVRYIYPISTTYHLLEYNNGDYQIVSTQNNKKLGDRFCSIKFVDLNVDSIMITGSDKGNRLFSFRTGKFSEDYYDVIVPPDSKHHLSACTQKGLLGFLDIRTSKLAIPLKFSGSFHALFCQNDDGNGQSCKPRSIYRYTDGIDGEKIEMDIKHLQFKGDYCIVPTSYFSLGVIDYTGKVLIDGYDKIDCVEGITDTLFKTCRNNRYSLYDKNMKPLLTNKKSIPILPIGIVHVDGSVLTNYSCTDTLTDIIFDKDCYRFLKDHGFKEVNCEDEYIYDYDETGEHVKEVIKGDKTYINSSYAYYDRYAYYDEIGAGVYDGKTGCTVIEPQWDCTNIYKNATKNKYVFSCYLGDYTFLLKENGDYVTSNGINF